MAALKGEIITEDRKQAMPPDSPTVELEVVGSHPPVTADPPAAARPDTDDSSDGGDYGGAAEFAGWTDKKIQDNINFWRHKTPTLPDAGKKMRRRIRRMKKELKRREVDSQRKVSEMWALRAHNRFGFASMYVSPLSDFGLVDISLTDSWVGDLAT
jgi:ubiquitin-like-specific protease 1C/D